jgi:uncharacterized membrane protein YkvA (DUF1232 family)
MMKRLKYLRYFFGYLRDRKVPWLQKIWIYLVIIYFLSPIDLLPDLILPGLGWIDDLLILLWAVPKLLRTLEDYANFPAEGIGNSKSNVISLKKYKYRSRL